MVVGHHDRPPEPPALPSQRRDGSAHSRMKVEALPLRCCRGALVPHSSVRLTGAQEPSPVDVGAPVATHARAPLSFRACTRDTNGLAHGHKTTQHSMHDLLDTAQSAESKKPKAKVKPPV